jgi:metal-sulfur cluster biosynthetic enzyme
MIDSEKIKQALELVIDPELNFDIVTLGLIYDIRLKEGRVEIDMTLTSTGCPYGPEIIKRINEEVAKIDDVKSVKVNIVWEPAWSKDKIDPLVRALLRGGF